MQKLNEEMEKIQKLSNDLGIKIGTLIHEARNENLPTNIFVEAIKHTFSASIGSFLLSVVKFEYINEIPNIIDEICENSKSYINDPHVINLLKKMKNPLDKMVKVEI